MILEEEFEDTKGVFRIRISKKNRQHNGQKKKYKSPPDFPTPNLIHKIYFLVNLSDRHWTIYQLFQMLGLEDLQGLDKMPPPPMYMDIFQ